MYLQAFPGDPDVVEFAVKELEHPRRHPFLSLHFDAFRYLGEHFAESKKLSRMHLTLGHQRNSSEKPDIALSAPVGKTQVQES